MENTVTLSGHTSGPWSLEREDDRLELKGDSGSKPIAHIYDSLNSEENEIDEGELERDAQEYAANARLIAAAPDLLDLAQRFQWSCEERLSILEEELEEARSFVGEDGTDDIDEQIEHWEWLLRKCNAVLASVQEN
jgi:hypothetical protein